MPPDGSIAPRLFMYPLKGGEAITTFALSPVPSTKA